MNRLWYRIAGNALTGFATGYVVGYSLGTNVVDAGLVGGLIQALLSVGKEFYEFGNYSSADDKKKSKLSSILLF